MPTTKAFVEHTMGMAISLHVRAVDPSRGDIQAGVAAAFGVLRRADAAFSTYRDDSDLMQMRRGVLTPADADPWTTSVRHLCAEAEAVTAGLFTTDLVGPDGTRGWDPTGVVKGWAVERAADVLREIPGITFCLNAGGDMVAGRGRGGLPSGVDATWRVGIADPQDASRILDVVDLTDGALATSGTGQRGTHIVDPRIGAPAAVTRRSVTVMGPDLAWADVWATVSFLDLDALPFSRMAASYRVVNVA